MFPFVPVPLDFVPPFPLFPLICPLPLDPAHPWQFTTRSSQIPLIWVEDAQKSRVSQWRDVKTKSGLISLSFPLSADPNLGEWEIKAKFGDDEEDKSFKVIEYGNADDAR